MAKILFVATSADRKGKVDQPTGVWYEEIAAPYNHFTGKGFEVTLSSVKGGSIPIDPGSLAEGFKTADVDLFLQNGDPIPQGSLVRGGVETAVAALKSSLAVAEVSADAYDAVFVPGGLGVMYDMPENDTVGKLLSDAWAQGKIVSAVCHGPGALLGAKNESGAPLVEGKRVAGFTNTEEEATGNTQNVPYLLEDKLKELGAAFERGEDWQPYVVQDGRLITGQNPASSKRVAELVEKALM